MLIIIIIKLMYWVYKNTKFITTRVVTEFKWLRLKN